MAKRVTTKQVGWAATAVVALSAAPLLGCGESELEGIEGRWAGTITCLSGTSELSLTLRAEEDRLRGAAQIRDKDSNSDFDVYGSQADAQRVVECLDNTCAEAADCAGKLDQRGQPGASTCQDGYCVPCFEERAWPMVSLTLKDQSVQIADPILELWRYGDQRMEGTIQKFCSNTDIQTPQVKITKE